VRNLRLLEAFHASVEVSRAPALLPLEELARRVGERVRQEEELCVDPDFFLALKSRLPRIRDVRVELKRGRYQNELTRFRYDVILEVADGEPYPSFDGVVLDWKTEGLSLLSVSQLLNAAETNLLTLKRIPNDRLLPIVRTAEVLRNPNGLRTAGELVSALAAKPAEIALDPEDFWGLAKDLSYSAEVGWSSAGSDDSYDAVFRHNRAKRAMRSTAKGNDRPWRHFANNPLQWLMVRKLVPQVRKYIQERLPEYMNPSAIVLLDSMPLTPNGKIDRNALPGPGNVRSEMPQPFVAPRDQLERQIAQIWEDTLNIHPVGIKDDFFELGGHSLLALVLLGRIQRDLGQQLPLSLFFPGTNVEALAAILRQPESSKVTSSLLRIQPRGRRPPFFCIHTALGFAFHYARVARHLGTDQPFYGVQAPGLEQDVEPLSDPREMASHYLEIIAEIEPNGPYLLGGSSLGGLVAFEMAQQLQSQGKEVALLALFDIAANPADRPTIAELDKVDDAELLAFLLSDYLTLSAERLRQMTTDQQLLYVLEQAKSTDIFPAGFGLKQLQRLLKVYKATNKGWVTYVAEPYEGKVTLFRAAGETGHRGADRLMGWGELATKVELHKVPGDHISMLREPQVRVFARRLAACIDSAIADT
jgi:thioesterase domain-containing protein